MSPTVQTVDGYYLSLEHPNPENLSIFAIAHALSNICRFTGHTSEFYSVAQHSVAVSYLVPPYLADEGLMHDAAEAVLGDVSSPLKSLLTEYREIEYRWEHALAQYYGLLYRCDGWPQEVKSADLRMLLMEKTKLMPEQSKEKWAILDGVVMPPEAIWKGVQTPRQAQMSFLLRAKELGLVAAPKSEERIRDSIGEFEQVLVGTLSGPDPI